MGDEKAKTKRGLPDYYLVREAQRRLYFDGKYPSLSSYADRPAFRSVARDLVCHYFPYSVQKQLSVVPVLEELYCIWLALAPSSFKMLGYWRPGWRSSVFHSWIREHIFKFKRVHLGRVALDFESADLRAGAEDARVTDEKFLLKATEFLAQGVGDTARAKLVRMVFAPLAFRLQGQDALAAARANKAGLMWYEDEILFLSKKPFEFPGVEWTDLSRKSADILHWRISFRSGDVTSLVAPHAMKDIKKDIRNIFKSDAGPQSKLIAINQQTKKFYSFAKHSYAARQQGWELDTWLWKQVGRRVTATNPKLKRLYFNLKNQAWDLKFRRPARDTLILNEIEDDQWRQIWNPRR